MMSSSKESAASQNPRNVVAVEYFTKAIQLDSANAQARIGLAEALTSQAGSGYIDSNEGIRKAREWIKEGLALNNELGEAYNALSELQMMWDWDFSSADASLKRALELEPGNASVIRGAAALARFQGHLDEAIHLQRQAISVDMLNPRAYKNLGLMLHYAGQQEEAASALHRALELNPETVFAHHFLGRVQLAESHIQEALAEEQKETVKIYQWLGLALVYDALGSRRESGLNLAELTKRQADYQIAEVYAARGEKDQAFKWLEASYRVRNPALLEIKGDPLLKNLRQDPRYTDLLKRMSLPI